MNTNLITKKILENEFSHLNNMQKKAVFCVNGPLLILAGAGSGKTTVLINRIVNILNFGNAFHGDLAISDENKTILEQYLDTSDRDLIPQISRVLNKERVKPWEILAITFTNKAAKELKERLDTAVGENAKYIWAQTFHATCTRILRANADKIGYTNSFTIYDEDDKKRVITEILRSLNLDEKKFEPRMISSTIGRAKDNLMNARAFKEDAVGNFFKETVASVFSAYEKRLFQSNAMDFDDIIAKTVLLLEQNPDVLEYYQDKFKYILVDEYQDTNHAQYKFVYMLANKHKNICVVGDDDQSIYKFRGATIKNILDFEMDYDSAVTIRLEQNYRSTSNILSCANGLIAKNTKRKGKNLWTDDKTDKKVRVHRVENQEDEARYIANKILDGVTSGLDFSDYAILYRNHALSNAIENALKRQAIPYRIFSGLRFFDRAEVKDMIAYLWVVSNANDTLRLKRIINNPPRRISPKTVEMIEYLANEEGVPAYDIVKTSNNYADLQRQVPALENFTNIIENLRKALEFMPLHEWYDMMLEQTGYTATLIAKDDLESKGRLENVYELKSSIIEYMGRCEDEKPSLSGFLEEISLFTDLDRADEAQSAVTMLTIHSAKGLEFKNVFICGMEDGIFPSFRSIEDPAEVEEERRLAYVAITRAKERLTMTCVERRLLYGQTKYYKPSIFITEIPEENTDSNISRGQMRMINSEREQIKAAASSFAQKSGRQAISVGLPAKKETAKLDIPYGTGDQIVHKAFGAGLITSTKPMGGDILLEIAFEKVGTKRLLAKTASSFITKA